MPLPPLACIDNFSTPVDLQFATTRIHSNSLRVRHPT